MIRYVITFGFGGFTANSSVFVPTFGFTPAVVAPPVGGDGQNNSNYISIGTGL